MEVIEGVAEIEDVDGFVARLNEIGEEHGVAVIAFDARAVVDRTHLERAIELADRARERDDAIADDHGIEILLYAAGRRQIERALAMGVTTGECPVAVVVHDRTGTGAEADAAAAVEALVTPTETLGEYDEARVREFFGIGDAELAATDADLGALVRERVALLSVEK